MIIAGQSRKSIDGQPGEFLDNSFVHNFRIKRKESVETSQERFCFRSAQK